MNKKGFTLIELIVTIAIISLVLVFTIYGINNVIKTSNNKRELITEATIKKSARIFAEESSSSWSKFDDNYEFMCTTVGELKNTGFINKNSVLPNKITDNNFLIVKRNAITYNIESEKIANNDEINKCTGQKNNEKEEITRPTINRYTSGTDNIKIYINEGSASLNNINSKIKYECNYGSSLSDVTLLGKFDNVNNICSIDNVKNNSNYYIYVYMITENGSKVLADGNTYYHTSDFSDSIINSSLTNINISYNSKDSNYNLIEGIGRYIKSNYDAISNENVTSCTLNRNNSFDCNERTTIIKKDVWYKANSDNLSLDYSGHKESSNVKIDTRVYDKTGNFKENNKDITLIYDKNKPTININNSSNGLWSKDDIILNITFSDTESGINPESLSYSYDGVNYISSNNTSSISFTDTYSNEINSNVIYRICDYNNNCETATTTIKIDKTKPVIEITNLDQCSGEQTQSVNCNLKFTDSGGSEINKNSFTYMRTYGNEYHDNINSNNTYVDSFTDEGSYDVTYKICDNAENCSSISNSLTIKNGFYCIKGELIVDRKLGHICVFDRWIADSTYDSSTGMCKCHESGGFRNIRQGPIVNGRCPAGQWTCYNNCYQGQGCYISKELPGKEYDCECIKTCGKFKSYGSDKCYDKARKNLR